MGSRQRAEGKAWSLRASVQGSAPSTPCSPGRASRLRLLPVPPALCGSPTGPGMGTRELTRSRGSRRESSPNLRCHFTPLADEGLWDMFVKDIPRSATSYTVSLDRLRPGVTYEFRVVAVNQVGYGEPSSPSTAVSGRDPPGKLLLREGRTWPRCGKGDLTVLPADSPQQRGLPREHGAGKPVWATGHHQ